MTLHNEQQTTDLEQDGLTETIIIGLRYTGRSSVVPPRRPRDQGGWPGRANFQGGPVAKRDSDGNVVEREPGPIQIGINPDWIDSDSVEGGTLAGLEGLGDFEVIYDPAELAETILKENYLPPAAFGGDGTVVDYDIREKVYDFLDIPMGLGTVESPDAEKRIREALAETAGMDTTVEEPPDADRKRTLKEENTRNELLSAAQEFEWADELDLRSAAKNDLAERLAEEPAADVQAALEDA